MLDDDEASVRFYTAEALGFLGDEKIGYELTRVLLNDADDRVRLEALRSLDAIKAAKEANSVMSAISDTSTQVKIYAIELSALWNNDRAKPKIVQMLKYDKNEGVRAACATALGVYKDKSTVPDLINALSDSDTDVRIYVLESLKKITSQDHGFNKTEWEEWYNSNKG